MTQNQHIGVDLAPVLVVATAQPFDPAAFNAAVVNSLSMKLLGNTMGNKTRPPGNGGLWPSDYAALAAKLKFD